jgi:hypothetical protein
LKQPRGALIVLAMVLAAYLPATQALAQPTVSVEPAPDGTLTLVGDGWRPGQELVVTVGPHAFAAQADLLGEFEVQTQMLSSAGPPGLLSVHRPKPAERALARLASSDLAADDGAHPYAVLFAQAMAAGAGMFALCVGGLGLLWLALRPLRYRRDRHY